MNNRFLGTVAASGAVIGLLSVYGIASERWELAFWLAAGAGWIALANRWLPADAFRHMVLGGAAAAFLAADVKVLLWDQYLSTHPGVAATVLEQGGVVRTSFLLSNTASGVIFGIMLGAPLAWWRMRQGPVSDEEE